MKYIALLVGKLSAFLLKILGRNGGSFPGKYAEKIHKNLIKEFKFKGKLVLVTGTNGKSGVTRMINSVFEKAGYNTISNTNGDNIIGGLVTVGIKNSDMNFRVKSDIVILEIDELTLAKNVKYLNPSDIVITNFFEDQLDRVGEMDNLVRKISTSLESYEGNIYINSDNIYSNAICEKLKKANVIKFSVDKNKLTDTNSTPKEICPICQQVLEYDYIEYDKIGKYHCKSCGFSSENPDYLAEKIDFDEKSFICKNFKYHFSIPALYQIYNSLAVISVCKENNIESEIIDSVISEKAKHNGRMEKIEISGKNILLNLVKNAAGANEIINVISLDKSKKTIIFILNNKIADGYDPSWIWGCNFEKIPNIKSVITSGKMTYEASLRFKYMNQDIEIFPIESLDEAVEKFISSEGNLYALGSYTAVEPFRQSISNKKSR